MTVFGIRSSSSIVLRLFYKNDGLHSALGSGEVTHNLCFGYFCQNTLTMEWNFKVGRIQVRTYESVQPSATTVLAHMDSQTT